MADPEIEMAILDSVHCQILNASFSHNDPWEIEPPHPVMWASDAIIVKHGKGMMSPGVDLETLLLP